MDYNPLFRAIDEGNVETVKQIMSDSDGPRLIALYGKYILRRAISSNRIEIASLLLKKMDIGSYDIFGETVLMYAIGWRAADIARLLIETGKSNPGAVDNNGFTALMRAIKKGMPEIAALLIKTGESDPGAVSKNGKTALMLAIEYGARDIAMLLVGTGESNPGAVSESGNTALMVAINLKMYGVAVSLIRRHLDENDLDRVNQHGETAADIAERRGAPDELLFLLTPAFEFDRTPVRFEERDVTLDGSEEAVEFDTLTEHGVEQFLQERGSNLVFKVKDHYFALNKEKIRSNIRGNIVFECVDRGKKDSNTNQTILEVQDRTRPYFNLNSVGLIVGFIGYNDLLNILDSRHQFFEIERDRAMLSFMNREIHDFRGRRHITSAAHCESGRGGQLNRVVRLNAAASGARPKKRKRESPSPPASDSLGIVVQVRGKNKSVPIKKDTTLGDLQEMLAAENTNVTKTVFHTLFRMNDSEDRKKVISQLPHFKNKESVFQAYS